MTIWLRFLLMAVAAVGMATLMPASGMAQAKKKHPAVQIITGPPAGTWYPSGAAIAEMVNALYDGQPISVITGPGGVGNPAHTAAGKSGLGISYGPFLVLAKKGNNDLYKDPAPTLCSIGSAPPNLLQMLLDAKYPADTIEKLKQTKTPLKIATGATGSTEAFAMQQILALVGVTFKDVESWGGRVDLMGTGERVDAWNNRQVDVVNSMLQHPHAGYIEMMTTRKAHLVSLSDKIRDQLAKDWGFQKLSIPGGEYPNTPNEVKTVGLPFVVYADTRAVSQEMIYDITKLWAEGKDRMIKAHVSHKEWEPATMMPDGLGIETCDATKRYFKERGWKS